MCENAHRTHCDGMISIFVWLALFSCLVLFSPNMGEHTLNQTKKKLKQMDTFNGKITLSIIQMNTHNCQLGVFPLLKCSLECLRHFSFALLNASISIPLSFYRSIFSHWILRLLSNGKALFDRFFANHCRVYSDHRNKWMKFGGIEPFLEHKWCCLLCRLNTLEVCS